MKRTDNKGQTMEWISVKERLPDSKPDQVVSVIMIDMDAALPPVLGWWDSSPEGGGFYKRIGACVMRIICTHYIILPKWPERSKREDSDDVISKVLSNVAKMPHRYKTKEEYDADHH